LKCKTENKILNKDFLKEEFDIRLKGVKRTETPTDFGLCPLVKNLKGLT